MSVLSFAQERLLAATRAIDERTWIGVRVSAASSAAAVEAAVRDLVVRHEILRTTFDRGADGARATILDASQAWPSVVWPRGRACDLRTAVTSVGAAAAEAASEVPLCVHAVETSDGDRLVLLGTPPYALDFWSVEPIVADFAIAHAARARGESPVWSALPRSLGEHAQRQRARASDLCGPDAHRSPAARAYLASLASPFPETDLRAAARQLMFWLTAVVGFTRALCQPGDPGAPGSTHTVTATIDPALHDRLARLARASATTVPVVLHAGIAGLLTALGTGSDSTIGLAVPGRSQPIVGACEDAMVLRVDASGNPSFAELIDRTRACHAVARDAEDVPIDVVLGGRPATENPLDVMLAVRDGLDRSPAGLDWWTTIRPGHSFRGPTELLIDLAERLSSDGRPAGIECTVEYAMPYYPRRLVEALLAHLLTVLDAAVTDPARSLQSLIECSYSCVARKRAAASAATTPAAAGRSRGVIARPRHFLHDAIAELWEQVIGTQPFGIDDDFFALGGTEDSYAKTIHSLAALYDLPALLSYTRSRLTIDELADACVEMCPSSLLLEIQPGDPARRRPLFFVHGDLAGGGLYLRRLARALGEDRPVHALQPHGVDGGDVPASIAAMADDHLTRMRAVSPTGPCHLAGYCNGAAVAFEMARRLQDAGRPVASLLLVDPPSAGRRDTPTSKPLQRLSPDLMARPSIRSGWLLSAYVAPLKRHEPGPYAGQVTIFWTGYGGRPAPRDMFEALGATVEIHDVPGTHHSVLGRHIEQVASAMKVCLDDC